MTGSFRLLRVVGIDVKLHFTFPLILLWGAFQWVEPHGREEAVFGALLMAALFAWPFTSSAMPWRPAASASRCGRSCSCPSAAWPCSAKRREAA